MLNDQYQRLILEKKIILTSIRSLNSLHSHSKVQLSRKDKNKPINNTRSETIANLRIYIIHRASPHEATLYFPPQSTDSKSCHREYQCRPISIRKVSPQSRIGVSVSFLAFKFTASPLVRCISAESRGWIFLTQFPWRTWP